MTEPLYQFSRPINLNVNNVQTVYTFEISPDSVAFDKQRFLTLSNSLFYQCFYYSAEQLRVPYIALKYTVSVWNFISRIVGADLLPPTTYQILEDGGNVYRQFTDATKLPPITMKRTIPDWGPILWEFLHTSSIWTANDLNILDEFCGILMNLNVIIPCGNCSAHYQQMNILNTFAIPLFLTNNAIAGVYELHELIKRNTPGNGPAYTLEDLCKKYKLRPIDTKIEHVKILSEEHFHFKYKQFMNVKQSSIS